MPVAEFWKEGYVWHEFTYDEFVDWFETEYPSQKGSVNAYIDACRQYDVSDIEAAEQWMGNRVSFNKTADGLYQITGWDVDMQTSTTNTIDSNIGERFRGKVRTVINRGKDAANKLNMSTFPASGSFGEQASYVIGSVGSAFAAVTAGITLGKTIDSALYNANPDFWDSHGMSALNPDTWASLTNGSDSPFAGLFNMILGINPDTGQSQLYMNQDALAYMAYYMQQNGFFGTSVTGPVGLDPITVTPDSLMIMDTTALIATYRPVLLPYLMGAEPPSNQVREFVNLANTHPYSIIHGGNINNPTTCSFDLLNEYPTFDSVVFTYNSRRNTFTEGRFTISTTYRNYSMTNNLSMGHNTSSNPTLTVLEIITPYTASLGTSSGGYYVGTVLAAPDGVGTQEGATVPDTSGWSDYSDVLPSLQQQYPDLWDDALVWDNVQPDGSNPQLTYVPVVAPDATSYLDTQPTSGTQTQTDTIIDPTTFAKTIIETIMKTIQQDETQPDPETQVPPQNPVDTGTGDTPIPVPSTGSASALWSVYHPTQAQINSLGAWLWTDNVIQQFIQLLNSPIEGIISLHKVFVPPIDSGTGTIVIGRLDSEVPSATVTQQYVYVDCGSVNLNEQFGNVFDYSPHTDVSLYLPFIGIVPLNVDDVMRSIINVLYGVDIFTGACLAMVNVTRDGYKACMYQYTGVASVEYPLTGAQHNGLIGALVGAASGIAGIAAASTGVGALAAGAAMTGSVFNATKTRNARSGGFSGNAGAMGVKTPYLIIERPQTKVATTFAALRGYPTNYSVQLGSCSGNVIVSDVHVNGINATDNELSEIEQILKSGVIV